MKRTLMENKKNICYLFHIKVKTEICIIKLMEKRIKSLLPADIKTRNNLPGRCFKIGCNDHYLGETGSRISERVIDYPGKDSNSNFFKHFVQSRHPVLDIKNSKIIEKGYKINARKRTNAEGFLIKKK